MWLKVTEAKIRDKCGRFEELQHRLRASSLRPATMTEKSEISKFFEKHTYTSEVFKMSPDQQHQLPLATRYLCKLLGPAQNALLKTPGGAHQSAF